MCIRDRYIEAEDSVKKFGELITLQDSIIATVYDSVFIATSDSIIAKKYHNRIIKDSDDVWAEERHGKKIKLIDKVYARVEHNIFITESDHIVNEAFYNSLSVAQLPGAESEIQNLRKQLKKSKWKVEDYVFEQATDCLLYTSPSPRDGATSRMPSSA